MGDFSARPWNRPRGVSDVLERIGGMKTLVYGALAILAGALLGLVIFTFGYAKGYAYFSHDSSPSPAGSSR